MKKMYLIIPFLFLLHPAWAQEVTSDVSFNPSSKTLIIRSNETGIDATVCSTNRKKFKNYGKHPKLVTKGWSDISHGSREDDSRSYIRFPELEQLNSKDIKSAILTLFAVPDHKWDGGGQEGDNSVRVERITQKWNSSEIAWTRQPEVDSKHYVIVPKNNAYDSINIDITSLVQLKNSESYGFMLRQVEETPYRSMVFYSSNHTNPARRPKLTLQMSKRIKELPQFEPMVEFPNQYAKVMTIDELSDAPMEVVEVAGEADEIELNSVMEISEAPSVQTEHYDLSTDVEELAGGVEMEIVEVIGDAPNVEEEDEGFFMSDIPVSDDQENKTGSDNPTTFIFDGPRVSLTIWDPNDKQGQIISVFLNDESQTLISGYNVSARRSTFNLTLNQGNNLLIIRADPASRVPELSFDIQMTDGMSVPQKKGIKVEQNQLDITTILIR